MIGRFFVLTCCIMFACILTARADSWVEGYCREDGIRVKDHAVPDANSPANVDYSDSLARYYDYNIGAYNYVRCTPTAASVKVDSGEPITPYSKSVEPSKGYADKPSGTSGYYGDNRQIHTGPRGGQYYINGNGKKTYVKKKK